MGKYEELKKFPEKQFRRLTGTQRKIFEEIGETDLVCVSISLRESIMMK